MACSAHLLSQSLYQSHRSSPASSRHLWFQARPAAAACPAARSSSSARGRRSLSVRAAASAEDGRRQVELTYDAQAKFNQLADQIDQDIGITRLNLFSPCKINVFLRITGKRPDGFHNLASLFHVVSLGDTIKFSLSPSKSKDRLSTNVAGVPVDESNLIIKALELYRKKTGTDKHFWIHLDKKVPTGAGLGGGSSNAATALWAANQFSGGIASEKDLQEWSGEIGSDIPFFFSRGAAYCTGRGEVVSLGDTIKFSLSPSKSKDRLSTNVAGVPVDESNLIIKALELYRKKTGTDKHFWIHLDKKVPTGAGLGGGSSNAATALWAANQFSGGIASEKDLQEWSGEIGSDIPFFFSRGAAYCTGRGEIVQDIPDLLPINLPMVLIKPPQACSTAEVYKRLRLDQTSQADPLALLKEITQNGISQDVCINDLEPPAFEVLRSLKMLKKRIIASNRGDYSAVFMSGSGSTIVGIGSPDPPAFVYDDDDYKDVFVSEACFLTREENEWYREPISSNAAFSKEDLPSEVAPVVD